MVQSQLNKPTLAETNQSSAGGKENVFLTHVTMHISKAGLI